MRLNRVIRVTAAEGPGKRFAIWTQGCPHCCDGCFAPHTWDRSGGFEIDIQELIDRFYEVADQIDGVTVLGGEPLLQTSEVADFLEAVRQSGKSVILFTGYTFPQLLDSADPAVSRILSVTDILIDGQFMKELKDRSRPMIGSLNQNIIFLSERIRPAVFFAYRDRFEIRSDSRGRLQINGMGDIDKLQQFLGGYDG